jgi:hypothetical protein
MFNKDEDVNAKTFKIGSCISYHDFEGVSTRTSKNFGVGSDLVLLLLYYFFLFSSPTKMPSKLACLSPQFSSYSKVELLLGATLG